ncbi:MAG TPA: AMIN domain-containing protein [Candidatus Dormibacteraeota bacterium]|nr:AMIN domain-containing protein [Candidatus Dormibacteraeota bacterium]
MQKHLLIPMLLLSCAAAQNTASTVTVKNVTTAREGSDLRVEITLSAPVKPSVETAANPNRIVLDFPDTICYDNTKNVAVHVNGVRQVRTGQHSTAPYVTRVVLDLDQVHPYVVTAEGNRIILTVAPLEKARSHGAPVAATSGNLIGVFRRHRDNSPIIDPNASRENGSLPAPPPTPSGPGFEPPSDNSSVAAAPPQPRPVQPAQPAAAPQTPAAQPSLNQNQVAVAIRPAEPQPSTQPQPAASAPAVVATPAPSNASAAAPPNLEAGTKLAETTPAPAPAPVAAPPVSETTAPAEVAAAPPSEAPAPAAAPQPATSTLIARTDDPSLRTVFKVKYVAEGVAYLEGGRAQGLKEGMKLEVVDSNLPAKQGDSANAADPRIVAELEVSAVAETSAVTDIHTPKRPVVVGDLAYLSSGDAEALVQQRALSATRQYPAVISFTEGDTLDEEARQEVPRPPLPSVNRARGRIGFDSIETFSHGTSSINSTDLGVVFRGDITRIGGTYWNLSGYWRGRITKESAASQQTLQNLINRTYHLNMTYDNPNSTLVAGFGRLYLPWAPSLDTLDGGYFGKRLSKGTVLGIFGGSTPDPSSWDYSPDRVMGGAFVNFEGGEFDGFHYSSTSGAGISMIKWAIDRPFVFFEDSISYKRTFAVYESAQLDSPKGNSSTPAPGPGLGRNFFTFRVNPTSRVELDFNYNYFRDIPTFDPNLVGTGLLDKYLFQGFSAGGRLEVWRQVWLSANVGRSSGTGDAKTSLNQMYGITFGRLPWIKLRADAHYAKFSGSFGSGSYEAFSLTRQLSDRLRVEVLAGQQNFASTLTTNTRGRFVTGTVETTLGPHYYLQGNFTTNRGDMSYDQVMFSIGYRFDSRRKGE